MNFVLFKQMLKVHGKTIMNYAFGSAFYMILMVWVYPSIAENTKAMEDLMKTLPEGLSKVFNLETGFNSFEGYISGKFYELLLTIILTLFIIFLSTQLVARLVDRGSMAYLLSTPTTRGKVAFTQAMVLITGTFLIMFMTTLAGFAGFALFIEDTDSLRVSRFIQLNLSAFWLFFAIGGISFLISCLLNDEKKALGLSGLMAFGFFSLDILAKLSEKLDWVSYITIYSFYKPSQIVAGEAEFLLQSASLLVIGLVAFGAGIAFFQKRDLPL